MICSNPVAAAAHWFAPPPTALLVESIRPAPLPLYSTASCTAGCTASTATRLGFRRSGQGKVGSLALGLSLLSPLALGPPRPLFRPIPAPRTTGPALQPSWTWSRAHCSLSGRHTAPELSGGASSHPPCHPQQGSLPLSTSGPAPGWHHVPRGGASRCCCSGTQRRWPRRAPPQVRTGG